MERIHSRTVEDVLKDGPPLEWFYGIGRTNTGIQHVNYNTPFRKAYDGKLSAHFGDWAHIGVVPRGFGLKPEQVDKYTPIIEKMHEHARRVFELSGFWPEEIQSKALALETIYSGQTSAPFRVILVPPLEV